MPVARFQVLMGDIGIARVLFAGDVSEEERRKGGGTSGSGGGTKAEIAFFFVSYTLIAAVTVFVSLSFCQCHNNSSTCLTRLTMG